MVINIVNPLKFSSANFATSSVTASQTCLLLWKVIDICESNSLKILVFICDRASQNRKLFKSHFHLTSDDDMNPDVDVTYHTRNMFNGSDNHFVYFICDVPNSLKTARNYLANSRSEKNARYTWKGEQNTRYM